MLRPYFQLALAPTDMEIQSEPEDYALAPLCDHEPPFSPHCVQETPSWDPELLMPDPEFPDDEDLFHVQPSMSQLLSQERRPPSPAPAPAPVVAPVATPSPARQLVALPLRPEIMRQYTRDTAVPREICEQPGKWIGMSKTIHRLHDAVLFALSLTDRGVSVRFQRRYVATATAATVTPAPSHMRVLSRSYLAEAIQRTAFLMRCLFDEKLFSHEAIMPMKPVQPNSNVFCFGDSKKVYRLMARLQFDLPGVERWSIEAMLAFGVLFGCSYVALCQEPEERKGIMPAALVQGGMFCVESRCFIGWNEPQMYAVQLMRNLLSKEGKTPTLQHSPGIKLDRDSCDAIRPCAPDMPLEPLLFHRVNGAQPYRPDTIGISDTPLVVVGRASAYHGVHYVCPLPHRGACRRHRAALAQGSLANRGTRGYHQPDILGQVPLTAADTLQLLRPWGLPASVPQDAIARALQVLRFPDS